MSKKILVLFSTLNQVVNYIAYKITNPDKIIYLTPSSKSNPAIKNEKWDSCFATLMKEEKDTPELEILKVDKTELEGLMNSSLDSKFFDEIYEDDSSSQYIWNLTGGQRIYGLKVYHNIISNGRRDIAFYIEGNDNQLMFLNEEQVLCKEIKDNYDRGNFELTLEKCLNLMGFKDGKVSKNLFYNFQNIDQSILDKNEFDYYLNLIRDEESFNSSSKDHLLKRISDSNKLEDRKSKLKDIFKPKNKAEEEFLSLGQSYPAGHVFEKLVAYKILKCIIENNQDFPEIPDILELHMGVKIAFEDNASTNNSTVDELDIVLLTKYGKIINIECKSGGMSGDNAKSTHYTTYALSGVFGAPIFATPSFEQENMKELNPKVKSALNAAKRANLNILYYDKIDSDFIKRLI